MARAIREDAGVEVDLRFDASISGPLPGDPNPFEDGTADGGFVCGPMYRWLRQDLSLLPLPVPADQRANGAAVYFADVIVHAASRVRAFEDLRAARWAYNDKNSRSGWFSMVERVAPLTPEEFFSDIVHAGSHVESVRLVHDRIVDAAAIDSNALLGVRSRHPEVVASLRTIASWGPFPIQPIVLTTSVPATTREAMRRTMLRAHERFGRELRAFGFIGFVDAAASAY